MASDKRNHRPLTTKGIIVTAAPDLLTALEALLAYTCDRGALCTSQPHLDARAAIHHARSSGGPEGAPDLLGALERTSGALTGVLAAIERDEGRGPAIVYEVLEEARAAIAKARGGSTPRCPYSQPGTSARCKLVRGHEGPCEHSYDLGATSS